MGVLQKAVPVATLAFVLSSMLAMGLGLKVAETTARLRNLRLVAMSLLVTSMLMPVAALVVAIVSRLILLPLSRLPARHGTSACE